VLNRHNAQFTFSHFIFFNHCIDSFMRHYDNSIETKKRDINENVKSILRKSTVHNNSTNTSNQLRHAEIK